MTNPIVSQLIAILILVAGISWMFGGKSLATKVVQWPFRAVLKQLKRAVKATLRATWNLGVKAVRAIFRGLWQFAKRLVA